MIRLCFERFVVTTLFRREFLYFYISVPGAEWSLDSDVRCVCGAGGGEGARIHLKQVF